MDCYVGSIQYAKNIFEQNLEAGLQKPILSEFVSCFMTIVIHRFSALNKIKYKLHMDAISEEERLLLMYNFQSFVT